MRQIAGLIALLAGCWLAAPLPALAEGEQGRRVALVIGNTDYADLPALAAAAGDAGAIAAELRWLGFEVVDGLDLTRAQTDAALDRFAAGLDGAEIGLVYFAGHAAQVAGQNYLLPVDALADQPQDLAREGLPMERLLRILDGTGMTGVVLIDAADADQVIADLAGSGEDAVRALAPVAPRPGLVVAYSAQPGMAAADGAGPRSVFADALLRNLAVPIDIASMLEIVRMDVVAATGGRQEPWISTAAGSVIGGLVGGAAGAALDLPALEPLPSLAPPSESYALIAIPPEAVEEEVATGDGVGVDADAGGEPLPAPPPEPEPVAGPSDPPARPAPVVVTRYPTMDLPERVLPGEPFPLMIWLSQTPITPEVSVTAGPGSSVGDDGALTMLLPDEVDWTLRVVLNAPGFRVGDGAGPIAEIAMAADGNSTPALYLLAAEPGAHPDGSATIRATLWHGATFLASVQRTVLVGANSMAPGVAEVQLAPEAGGLTIDPGYRTADLTMRVDYADPAGLGRGQVIIASPHFQAPLIVGTIDTPAAVGEWLAFQYESFIRARNQDRARGGQHTGRATGEALTPALLRGFGQELYKRFAPQLFKDALWALVDDPDVTLGTIQIYSNNPLLPWELMWPVSADGGRELDFLGVAFQVARWHGADGPSMFERPRQDLAFEELVAIAPNYAGGEALDSLEAEIASLRDLPGFREVPGRFGAVQSLFAEPPHGIVHFAGHGVVSEDAAGPRSYVIKLEDLDLNVMAWRGLGAGRTDDGVFYFFNACDIGQAGYVANFVDGWAPAVLEAGASGFIGGLWPVFDDSAAAFAGRFYAEIDRRMADGPASVAAVLRDLRAGFAETGDPTWLSYVYYGDVNLRLTRGMQ